MSARQAGEPDGSVEEREIELMKNGPRLHGSTVKLGYYGIGNQTISFRNNEDSGINRYY